MRKWPPTRDPIKEWFSVVSALQTQGYYPTNDVTFFFSSETTGYNRNRYWRRPFRHSYSGDSSESICEQVFDDREFKRLFSHAYNMYNKWFQMTLIRSDQIFRNLWYHKTSLLLSSKSWHVTGSFNDMSLWFMIESDSMNFPKPLTRGMLALLLVRSFSKSVEQVREQCSQWWLMTAQLLQGISGDSDSTLNNRPILDDV